MDMDFEFKWFFIAFGVFMVVAGIHDIYKTHLNTQIELAKIQYGKCDCNATEK